MADCWQLPAALWPLAVLDPAGAEKTMSDSASPAATISWVW
jgi:hypothetical protein